MNQITCSFCGKTRSEVRKLISGPNVYICDQCVVLCSEVFEEEVSLSISKEYSKPKEIMVELDQYVIGQKHAKQALAVAIYNHYKRINYHPHPGDIELAKGNILLIGPTGCGKTLLAQALAKKLEVPLAITDATTLTEAGYVGEDVESIVKALYRTADGDLEATTRGIICIDEIDKLSKRENGPSVSRDVSGEGVQQALLKLLEGRTTTLPPDGPKTQTQQDPIQIDTSNILFICCGAFNGIEEIIGKRVGEHGLGFGANPNRKIDDKYKLRSQIQHEDLIAYGMIPEFMGRLPIIIPCEDLDVDSLVEILWKPKNALIKQYERLLSIDGIQLNITEGAMRAIAEKAITRKSGARGLRSVMESVMLDIMFSLPSMDDVTECTITADSVLNGHKPNLLQRKKAS